MDDYDRTIVYCSGDHNGFGDIAAAHTTARLLGVPLVYQENQRGTVRPKIATLNDSSRVQISEFNGDQSLKGVKNVVYEPLPITSNPFLGLVSFREQLPKGVDLYTVSEYGFPTERSPYNGYLEQLMLTPNNHFVLAGFYSEEYTPYGIHIDPSLQALRRDLLSNRDQNAELLLQALGFEPRDNENFALWHLYPLKSDARNDGFYHPRHSLYLTNHGDSIKYQKSLIDLFFESNQKDRVTYAIDFTPTDGYGHGSDDRVARAVFLGGNQWHFFDGIDSFYQKSLRILHVGNRPHNLFLRSMLLSDLPPVMTGDMSLSEAISAGQFFWYSAPPWKVALMFEMCVANGLRNTEIQNLLVYGDNEMQKALLNGDNESLNTQFAYLFDQIHSRFNLTENLKVLLKGRESIRPQKSDSSCSKIFNKSQ